MKVTSTAHTDRQGIALNQLVFEEAGFLFREQVVHDYGIDAHVEIVQNDRPTGRILGVQIKSGSSFFSEKTDDGFIYRSDDDHIQYWLNHSLPIILTLCNIETQQVYWQALSASTVTRTGRNWKLIVPKNQIVGFDSTGALADLATRIVPENKYTVLRQEDNSVGMSKRYSLTVLLNHNLSKPEIAAVIRQVTQLYADSQYHRNKMAAARWKGKKANIIFVYVYLTPDDAQNSNHFCRSLWIDKKYPDDLIRPSLEGENIGSNIVTEWSSLYSTLASIHRSHAISKEDYLDHIESTLEELLPVMQAITAALGKEVADPAEDAGPALKAASKKIGSLEKQASDIGRPPIECGEVHLEFRSAITHASNIVTPFLLENIAEVERNRHIELLNLEYFYQRLDNFLYELRKAK